MSLSMLAVRIPESMHKYIKFKALDTGKQQQEMVAEIILAYQKTDADYMRKFEKFTEQKSDKEVPSHDY